jgi:hypothetical protein
MSGFISLGLSFSAVALAEDCTIAKDEAKIKDACKKGGRAEAAKTMKGLLKAYNTAHADKKMQCDSCHVDTESYKLKDNAKTDFKKLETK